MITASALSRLINCPGSYALPQTRTSSVWADMGQDNHRAFEDAIHEGDYSMLPAEIREELGEYDVIQAEVAVAYDVATGVGRELGVGIGRKYVGLGPFEIAGTADLVAIDSYGKRLLTVDWKLHREVDWIQTTFYTLALCRRWGIDRAAMAVAYLGEGSERVRWKYLDALDLDAFAAEQLATIHTRVASECAKVQRGILPDVSEGAWCNYCPAQPSCPARVAMARRVLSGDDTNAMALMRPLDDEMAAKLHTDIKRARQVLAQLEKAVYARAAESPIPLGDGRFLGLHTNLGNEKVDGDIAYAAVRATHGQEVADRAVTRNATKSRLRDVLGAKEAKHMLTAIDEAGGISRAEKTEVCEYEAKPRLVASQSPALAETEGQS